MKFLSESDVKFFLIEADDSSLVESITDWKVFEPTEQQLERFFAKRKKLVSGLKSFRRSQSSKGSWRQNRFKIMKGIKAFHKSTEGKRFHRALGRHLANRAGHLGRMHGIISQVRDRYESMNALKSLSSVRTHAYIKAEYYRALDEDVDYDLFLEEFIPASLREEERIFNGSSEVNEEDLDILMRAIEPEYLLTEIATGTLSADTAMDRFTKLVEQGELSYPEILNRIVS